MVSNNRYLNTRSRLFDLQDEINAANQCNARLMAEEISLRDEISKLTGEIGILTAEVRKLREVASAKEFVAYKMDAERRKVVNEKRRLESELTSLRRFVSELAVENKLDSVCRHCRWCDEDGVSCNCPDSCFFAESEES